MKSLWNEAEAAQFADDPLAMRVYTSRLLGQDPSLVLHGGGNTSVKIREDDFFGQPTDVLYVKGSGWDLATIEKPGFSPVRLDTLLKLAEFETLSDSIIVREQRAALLDPFAPNPSVEAILHAVIPAKFVDHTHTDAVIAVMNTPDGEANVQKIYGDRVFVVPYVMPGFKLARAVYEMTRDLDWGVDVPLPEAEGKKLYVWLDAPIGYISSTKQWAKDHQKDWEAYWKKQPDDEDNSTLIHFIGKDNIVFHCIIFPSILHAHGDYILPENVPANEFLNLEGKKISTSRNWAVWLHEYLDDFPGKEDVLRYVLCTILPETKDSEFTWKDYQAKNNNELVAILGNFVNRTLVLTHKYFGGQVPASSELQSADQEALSQMEAMPQKIATSIESFRFREAIALLMDLARVGNKYLADTEPWKVIKEDEERVKTILNTALQITASLGILAEPFLPFTANKLRQMLNMKSTPWEGAGSADILSAGHEIQKASLLFEKIEDTTVDQQVQKLETAMQESQQEAKPASIKDEIAFPDFEKIDIRVATVLEAEKVKKSKKLLKLTLDTGVDRRIVLSGIAQQYTPEEVVGKQVCVLANLAPRKMMGTESQGMVLMAEDAEGTLSFIRPEDMVKNGSAIS